MKSLMKMLAAAVFVAAIGFAPSAFAHGGYGGYGGHMGWGGMMGPGYGGHMMGYGSGGHMMGPGYYGHMGWWGDRSDLGINQEQAEKLEKERDAFFKESRDLREKIYDKSAEINRELSRENPNRDRIVELQKALSQLEGELNQQQLDHQLKIRKIAPEIGSRFSGDYGPGSAWCFR